MLSLAAAGCVHGDDRGRSLDPDAFIATARLPEDLRLELAASEPAVVDPVAVAFDADGRMFVVEMGDYPMRPDESPPLGRVKRLVDADLDGYYETWTLFADRLPYPTSVLPWRDGVLVTAPPDIVHLRDRDDDGVADLRKVLFTGFPVANTQHNINGLTWGIDNWVYGANGGNHGSGHPAGRPEAAVSIRGTDFRFRPDTGALLVETVDGELLDGILAAETAAAVTLSRANGESDTVPRRPDPRAAGRRPLADARRSRAGARRGRSRRSARLPPAAQSLVDCLRNRFSMRDAARGIGVLQRHRCSRAGSAPSPPFPRGSPRTLRGHHRQARVRVTPRPCPGTAPTAPGGERREPYTHVGGSGNMKRDPVAT